MWSRRPGHGDCVDLAAVKQLVEVRQDMAVDPDGQRLARYIAAHLVLERLARRRTNLVQLTAVLAVMLGLAAMLSVARPILRAVAGGCAVAVIALLAAVASEVVRRLSLSQMTRGVRIETIDPRDQRVAPRR